MGPALSKELKQLVDNPNCSKNSGMVCQSKGIAGASLGRSPAADCPVERFPLARPLRACYTPPVGIARLFRGLTGTALR
jgi:hypothetical protein